MGAYRGIHLQKGLVKIGDRKGPGINLTLDTTGDWYSRRSAGQALTTQPQYEFPIAVALNFRVFRNLSFSPTYTVFRYASQVTGQSLVDSYSISLKWYFARDSAVPPRRQLYYHPGPNIRGPDSVS
jgi:hypothetical protein